MSESGGQAGTVFPPGGNTQGKTFDSGVVANAAAVATMIQMAGLTNFITGFTVSGQAPTGAATVTVTVTGPVNVLNYVLDLPAAASGKFSPVTVEFGQPIPASAQNVAIVVSCPAFGAGSTAQCVNFTGFRQ